MSWNSNAYQYSCSPEHEPNTEEHQILGKTEPLKDDMAQTRITKNLNKYIYPEFAGYEGEHLLKEIVSAVLPLALARTWEKTMSFGGEKPWVGTERISQRASITQRKIQQDLKDLQDLELLEIKVGYKTTVNNDQITDYRAEYKDFSKLYTLAHEYHEWRQSRLFLIYQPIWQDCKRLREEHELYMRTQEDKDLLEEIKRDQTLYDEICAAEELYKSLLRFHNYRRLLTQKVKPSKSEKSLGGAETHNGHLLAKTKNSDWKSSPYESIVNSNYLDSSDSNMTQDLNLIQEDSPPTRSSGGEHPHDERGTHTSEDFDLECGKGDEEYSFSIPESAQRPTEPSRKRNTREVAKEISAQQKGKAYIEAVLTEEDRKHSTPKQERRNKWLESEELRKEHKGIVNMYSHIADRLNDQNPKSTETLLAKMQKEIGMSEEEFIAHVDYARQKVLSIPQDKIRKRGADGQPNRTPLFLQILKDALKRGITACQEDDRRADEIRNMFKVVEQPAAQLDPESEPELDEEAFEEAMAELERKITASHKAQQEIMAKIVPSDSDNELEIDQPQKPVEQNQAESVELPTVNIVTAEEWTQAKIAIKAVAGGMILPNSGCSNCGCRLGAVIIGHEPYCVQCRNDIPGWTEEMYRSVDEIIGQLYRHEIA